MCIRDENHGAKIPKQQAFTNARQLSLGCRFWCISRMGYYSGTTHQITLYRNGRAAGATSFLTEPSNNDCLTAEGPSLPCHHRRIHRTGAFNNRRRPHPSFPLSNFAPPLVDGICHKRSI